MQITPSSREAIATEVYGLLAKRRMSQDDLASRIGISRSSLSARLTGKQAFTVEQLQRIAEALGADFLDLLGSAA